jgi:hypothetical protein
MRRLWRHPGWAAAVVAGIAIAAACSDRTDPVTPKPGGGGKAAPGKPIPIAAVGCVADVARRTVTCDRPPGADRLPRYLIIGGQNVYVTVSTANVSYDPSTTAYTFDLRLRNLIPQSLGTTDGSTLDPSGVRIFFASGPVATSGSGAITVTADGTATFTAPNQPYYEYDQVLAQFDQTGAKTWQLNVPASVTTFAFTLLVAAPVQFPNGYIDVVGNPNLREGTLRTYRAVVRTPVGNIDSTSVTNLAWTESAPDALLAGYVTPVTDTARVTVHGYRYGAPVIGVNAWRIGYDGTSVPVSGSLALNVLPIRRYWTGATDNVWETGSNWLPDSIAPVPEDTAVVTDTASATNFPTLTANESIAGVEVLDLTPGGVVPSANLAAFDLTATGDVLTTNSGAITNTSGVLDLTGTGRTVAGTIPFFRVTGTYSLIGNVTARALGRVDLGRLRNTGFRIRITSF